MNPMQKRSQTSAGMGPYGGGSQTGYAPRVQNKGLQQPTRPQQQQAAPKQDSGGLLGGLLSDERSKKEIARLEGQNDALTAALDKSFSGSNMPETEYPQLPQNTRVPVGQASFPDLPPSPAAEKVAAQNVGMQSAQGPAPQQPSMGTQTNPSQANFARSNNPVFNVRSAPPDLSALDEAYKRMGQGG